MQTEHGERMTDDELAELELGSAVSAGAVREIRQLREVITVQEYLLKRAMDVITEAIMHGMPVTEEVAAVRNAIVCGHKQRTGG